MDRREALATLAAIPVSAITSVERVEVKPGQALVVECDKHISAVTAAHIKAVCAEVFPGVKVLVLGDGLHLKAVDVVPS